MDILLQTANFSTDKIHTITRFHFQNQVATYTVARENDGMQSHPALHPGILLFS